MCNKQNPSTGDLCRTVALSVLILTISLSFLLGIMSVPVAAGCVAAACAILTLLPSADEQSHPSRGLVWIQAAAALAAPLLIRLAGGPERAPAILTLLVLGPLVVALGRHDLTLASDRDFLSMDLPGWEYLLAVSKKTFTGWTAALLALAWTGPVPALLSLSALSLLLALLLVRSVTNQSLLSTRFESGVLGKVRDMPFLRPVPAARLGINHRMMFEKICQYMETNRPYLKDSFCIEDLARAVYTNKSYLSRVINSCTGMNYPQFVNNYRVRYSVDLFRKDPRLKVAELAMMSGFHSGVTFTFAFRLFLGKTPSDWCREYRERVEEVKEPLSTSPEGERR